MMKNSTENQTEFLKNRLVIALSVEDKNSNFNPKARKKYMESLKRTGAFVHVVDYINDGLEEVFSSIDGVVLTGGGDISPVTYGGEQHPELQKVNFERDVFEMEMVKKCIELEVPLLGICRGLQVINVALGGSLIPHLADQEYAFIPHRSKEKKNIMHEVALEPHSKLFEIYGQGQLRVESMHHQAIDQLASSLEVSAYAKDGVIEAIEMPEHPWLKAVQWHPEISLDVDPVQQTLFEQFVSYCWDKKMY